VKSMEQMQSEMLSHARWDGGYPRPVCMFPGIVALAYDEKQWKELNRANMVGIIIYCGGLGLGAIALIIYAIWIML